MKIVFVGLGGVDGMVRGKKGGTELNLNDYYTVMEAAVALGLTDSSIWEFCRKNKFDGAIKIDKRWYIPKIAILIHQYCGDRKAPKGTRQKRKEARTLRVQEKHRSIKAAEEIIKARRDAQFSREK